MVLAGSVLVKGKGNVVLRCVRRVRSRFRSIKLSRKARLSCRCRSKIALTLLQKLKYLAVRSRGDTSMTLLRG